MMLCRCQWLENTAVSALCTAVKQTHDHQSRELDLEISAHPSFGVTRAAVDSSS